MKKRGLLHRELSAVVAGLGHGDLLLITDAGFPLLPGTRLIDLAVCANVPRFLDVLRAVLEEIVVEGGYIAVETRGKSPHIYSEIQSALPGAPLELISHTRMKELAPRVKAAVRTGEFTPFANVVLRCGVAF
ncbi:MAG: D-ribose pyranase [Kyrpidia sp.]|nr:D-ribose pyranase [Kyrpidia sp.]